MGREPIFFSKEESGGKQGNCGAVIVGGYDSVQGYHIKNKTNKTNHVLRSKNI